MKFKIVEVKIKRVFYFYLSLRFVRFFEFGFFFIFRFRCSGFFIGFEVFIFLLEKVLKLEYLFYLLVVERG